MMNLLSFSKLSKHIEQQSYFQQRGKVTKVIGMTLEVEGLSTFVGEICEVYSTTDRTVSISAEVVGFQEGKALLMPLGKISGIGPNSVVISTKKPFQVQVGEHLLGKILDGLGNPIEEMELKGVSMSIDRDPPNPLTRPRIQSVLSTGVKAIDGLLTVGEGQRMGIFAGSGVGKSTLLGMVSRYSEADINVICLIGERGREVLEFIERDLGPEGMKKTVVVCATSDQPALIRIKSAYVATTIAEYFRDQGKKVMLMMDSVTRFAMAQREVGLAIGEPPTSKGYTPSVFALLPSLLERAGMSDKGSITAFYTVLVDGDDMNEIIADTVRGILDGHIVLSRKIAARNHYPAIDVNASISRLMKELVTEEHYQTAGTFRDSLAIYQENEDLISIGAYKRGNNLKLDQAVSKINSMNDFLKQRVEDGCSFDEVTHQLSQIMK